MLSTLWRRKGRSRPLAADLPDARAPNPASAASPSPDLGRIAQDAVQLAAVGPRLAAFAGEVEKQARSQADRAAAMAEAMERLARDLNAAVAELRSSSGQMGQALATVGQIADHTRILSINASIEAARAGEQGRAFAVIVDEVKKLADRTGRTTLDIGERMGEFAASLVRMDTVTQARAAAGEGADRAPTVGDVNLQVRGIAESAGFQLANAESVHAMGGQIKALTESLLLAVGKFRFDAHDRARAAVEELLPSLASAWGERGRLEGLLESWLEAQSHFELAYLTDAHGRQLVDNLARRSGRVVHDPAGYGRDWAARPWFRAALAHGGACSTDVYRSSATGDFCFTIAAALRDSRGGLLGVLGSDVNFQRLVSG
jgi:hypothetical protein